MECARCRENNPFDPRSAASVVINLRARPAPLVRTTRVSWLACECMLFHGIRVILIAARSREFKHPLRAELNTP
jgi:hypothetical protein